MDQRIAMVTGANGGLGSFVCETLARSGIGLILVDRSAEKSRHAADLLNEKYPAIVKGIYGVDLASHQDIRRVTSEILTSFPRMDFLFNNAGVLTETLQFSGHGNELHFEVNTLAPLQLIDQLRPSLKAAGGAMIVNTSAGLSLRAKTLNWDELLKPTTFRKLYGPYVNSKEALNVLTAALADELSRDRIVVRAADPGPNQTGLTKGKGTPLWMRLFYRFLPTPEKGAKKIVDAGVDRKFRAESGVFITGGEITALPPALNSADFQANFLAQCRLRASLDR